MTTTDVSCSRLTITESEFVVFAEQLIAQRQQEGRTSCATKYRTTLNSPTAE